MTNKTYKKNEQSAYNTVVWLENVHGWSSWIVATGTKQVMFGNGQDISNKQKKNERKKVLLHKMRSHNTKTDTKQAKSI